MGGANILQSDYQDSATRILFVKFWGNKKIYIYLWNTTLWALKLCRVKSLSQMCN